MKTLPTKFEGAQLIIPEVYMDKRGFFKETYQNKRFEEFELPNQWVQDGISFSKKKYTLRGLHKQVGMSKLVTVLRGSVFDVIVDGREGSSTFGQWESFILNEENHHQLYISAGLYHGFMTLTKNVVFSYKMDNNHQLFLEDSVNYLSADLDINWPHKAKVISDKDKNAVEFVLNG